MKPIRVLMITMPRLQADVIESALAAVPDIQMVGDVTVADAEDAVAATVADVVILGDGETLQAAALHLLAVHPRLTVIGLVDSGRQAVLFDCRPVVQRLGDASPHALVDVIVGATRTRRPEIVL
ncbi:MAG TPA: hypothetical protein VHI11_07460 [Jiangellaceae bacterium]|nr:hypothetical protein [Jiangellaceae bacterium]